VDYFPMQRAFPFRLAVFDLDDTLLETYELNF